MALTPTPDSSDLDTFSQDATEVFTIPQKILAIEQATVLLWLATRVDSYTGDETVDKIIKWAVLDMAWSLLVKTENKTAINSPFSSERIGSYSYSKATRQVQSGQSTGVEWFDAAVTLLLDQAGVGVGAVWSVSERVFRSPMQTDDRFLTLPNGTVVELDALDFPTPSGQDPQPGAQPDLNWVDGGTP